MSTSSEPESERTELSTQDLPEIPTVEVMEGWNKKKLLRWIKKRDPNILEGDNLKTFNEAYIMGRAFLASGVKFYQRCGLPRGVGQALKNLADEVKEGKFIP
jgi:hypothetical protein